MRKDNIIKVKLQDYDFKYGWIADKCYLDGNWKIGEEVDVYIYGKKKGKLFCRVENDCNSETDCPVSHICSGCSFRKYTYEGQLEIKREYISKICNLDIDIIGDKDHSLYYRNKVELTFGGKIDDLKLGYHYRGLYGRIFNAPLCRLYPYERHYSIIKEWALENNLIPYHKKKHKGDLRHILFRRGVFTNEEMILLHTTSETERQIVEELADRLNVDTFIWYVGDDKGDAIKNGEEYVLKGKGIIHEKLGSIIISIGPFTFFQTNSYMVLKLYNIVKEWVKGKNVLDLYAGIGSIGMFISKSVETVLCVEENASSVEEGKRTAKENGLNNISFIHSRVEDIEDIKDRFDTVIIDPPRMGLSPKSMKNLLSLLPDNIVYVSCNPETFVRDKEILENNNYRLKDIKGVDMFPYTRHLELVSRFEKE